MSVEIHPLTGIPDVRPGDDLSALLTPPLRALGPRDADVVAVTQKIVSKAEGRLIPGWDRADAVARETVRVVARRGDLVIAETVHGFVCANAGVDASNVEAGTLALLPEDPDGTAEQLRAQLTSALGVSVGVVITDTFGRAWRNGVVNVAIGCAGMPAVVDLRGTRDHTGQELDATIVALADEVAAAGGLVMGKAARIPAALVRGIDIGQAAPSPAADLVRPASDDLFRESPLQALHARRTIRSFGPAEVPRPALEEAVLAACSVPTPHGTPPWRFTVLTSGGARALLRAALPEAAELSEAPVLIVPWLSFAGSQAHADPQSRHAEQEVFLLSGGAAIHTLQLALHAQGLGSCWVPSALFAQEPTRAALGMDEGWFALGTVACGPMSEGGAVGPRPAIDLAGLVTFR